MGPGSDFGMLVHDRREPLVATNLVLQQLLSPKLGTTPIQQDLAYAGTRLTSPSSRSRLFLHQLVSEECQGQNRDEDHRVYSRNGRRLVYVASLPHVSDCICYLRVGGSKRVVEDKPDPCPHVD